MLTLVERPQPQSFFPTIAGAQEDFSVPVDTPPVDTPPTDTWSFPSEPSITTPPVDGTTVPDMSASSPDNQVIAQDVAVMPQAWQDTFAAAERAGMSSTEAFQSVQAAEQANRAANQGILDAFSTWKNQPLYDPSTGALYTNVNGAPGQQVGSIQSGVFVPSQVQMPNGQMATPQYDDTGNVVGYYRQTASGGADMFGANGAYENTAGQPPAPSGWLGKLGSALGGLSSFLGTPGGRLLAGLGAGALSTGLAGLIASNQKRVPNAASITPNAATVQQLLGTGQGAALTGLLNGGAAGLSRSVSSGLQGQGTLADLLKLQTEQSLGQQAVEQPFEQQVGMTAVGQLPGQMNATTNPNITGTAKLGQEQNTLAQGQNQTQGKIMTGLGTQVENVLNGNYSNPILENQVKLARDAFNAKMYAQLGPGWETSTPGMQAKEQQDLLESSQRFQDRQQTLATQTPLYSGMLQGAVGNQQQATGQVQQAQGQGVSQNAALSQMGKVPTGTLAQGLTSITPVPAFGGLQSASYTNAQLVNSQQADNMANVNNANAVTNSLAKGVGDLGGFATRALTGSPGTLATPTPTA